MRRLRDTKGRPLRVSACHRSQVYGYVGRKTVRLDDQGTNLRMEVGGLELWVDAKSARRLGFALLTWSLRNDPGLLETVLRAHPAYPVDDAAPPPAAARGKAAAGASSGTRP